MKKCPEKYVQERCVELEQSSNDDDLSDSDPWAAEFEDEEVEDNTTFDDTKNVNVGQINSNYAINDHSIQKMNNNTNTDIQVDNGTQRQEEEATYMNFETPLEKHKTHTNFNEPVQNFPPKNVSRLHSGGEKTLAEQLKEQLELRNAKKPTIEPKPTDIVSRRIKNISCGTISTEPRKSFLHTESKKSISVVQKRMAVPPPPTPKKNVDQGSPIGKIGRKGMKASIRSVDLVANLLPKPEDSDDGYEEFDDQLIEQIQKSAALSRIDSKLSLASGQRSSTESIVQPPSANSCEDKEQESYKFYESIREPPEYNGYLSPIQRSPNSSVVLPPLPLKLPQTPSPTPSLTRPSKTNSANERSPDKKSATLPHSSSNSSLSSERATRPLPPPPDRLSYNDKPWFHNVTREEAILLMRDQGNFGIPQDGYFLLRPSITNVNNPLALVLWCRDRFYNIPVRKRPDNRYALGSAKLNEQSFSSVEEIVTFYTNEELVLHTGEVTKLTETPPK